MKKDAKLRLTGARYIGAGLFLCYLGSVFWIVGGMLRAWNTPYYVLAITMSALLLRVYMLIRIPSTTETILGLSATLVESVVWLSMPGVSWLTLVIIDVFQTFF